MVLDRLGPAWAVLQEQLRASVRVLIVDDEEIVRTLLTDVIEMSGYQVDSVATAEEALTRIRETTYSLLVTDKNLPGADGIDLIAQVKAEGIDLPSILVTGYPSVETISRALASGASDYIAKPFEDIGPVQKRMESVIEAHQASKLFGRIVSDLQAEVESSGLDADTVRQIGRELFVAKQELASRPDVLLMDTTPDAGELTGLFLAGAGLTVVQEASVAKAKERVKDDRGPLVVFLSLEIPDVNELISDLLAMDSRLEILVSGSSQRLDEAISAVWSGATDFVLGAEEGLDMLTARVKRAVFRARRRRLYLDLLATLYRFGRESGTEAAEILMKVAPESARPFLEKMASDAPPPPADDLTEDVDLSDLFEDEVAVLPTDRTAGPMERQEERGGEAKITGTGSTTVLEQIEYGLDSVREDRTIEVPLRGLLRVYATLGELVRFFHAPSHYQDPQAVAKFLGSSEDGALAAMIRTYYEDLREFLPRDIIRELDEGDRFNHPRPPGYLKPNE